MSALVKTHRAAPVATVELNRPERHNSLIPELLRDLLDAFAVAANDDDVHAVVLAAAGKSFSTGGDVLGFSTAGGQLAEYAAETVGLLNEAIMAMIRMDKPIVAAVHGMVTGGSLGLLLGADVVLMAPEATITPWYSTVGYAPDGGWTAILPGIIGKRRVARLLLHDETITADEAVAWGLAAEMVDAPAIRNRAVSIAAEMTGLNPESPPTARSLLGADHEAVAAGLEAERQAFVEQILTPEARRGMDSFLGRLR
ncbi:MAG: enoyl-CoA hydratase/isomerase family protein [bacterium]|nr:enoyl-CoA hydratase/isomerase family protein [bacterium]